MPIKIEEIDNQIFAKSARAMLELLSENPNFAYTVKELIEILNTSRPTVYRAATILQKLGLIDKKTGGRRTYFFLKPTK